MCIRDSAHLDRLVDVVGDEDDRLAQLALQPQELVLQPLTVCLLYTSDAADDLLCVDLGGRRIIKKKKTHQAM